MAPERKLYLKLKKYTPRIKWTRLENISLLGTPDLLGYNDSGNFFTVELKVTKGKKLNFHHTKLPSMWSIHTTLIFLLRPLVKGPQNILDGTCTVVLG